MKKIIVLLIIIILIIGCKTSLALKDDSNNDNDSDQTVDFIVCMGDKIPVVMIEVASESAKARKLVAVMYSNGSVKAEVIGKGHFYHVGFGVDANKNVASVGFMHMGDQSSTLKKVTNGNVVFLGMYGKYDVEEIKYYIEDAKNRSQNGYNYVSESEYNKFVAGLNESQYKFVEIGTELNNQNVDTYVR